MEKFIKNNKLVLLLVLAAGLYYYFKIHKPKAAKKAASKKGAGASGAVGGGASNPGHSVDPSAGDELVNLGMEDELNVSDQGVDTPVFVDTDLSGNGDFSVEPVDDVMPILSGDSFSGDSAGFIKTPSNYAITGDYCKTASGGDGIVNNYGECVAHDYSTQTQTL